MQLQGPLIVCSLGNLAAGAHASVVVRMIPKATTGQFVNIAVVGSATQEPHARQQPRSRGRPDRASAVAARCLPVGPTAANAHAAC